ncbi:Metallothionein expression activator [Ceratobasidium sp. 394]|nr:Metallothionein expression activator [Ceratobasidium sp. 394]
MSFFPYYIDQSSEGSRYIGDYMPYESAGPAPTSSCLPFNPMPFQNMPPHPTFLEAQWSKPIHSSWDPQLGIAPNWDQILQSLESPPLPAPNYNPPASMQPLGYDAGPDYEACSPLSTTASDPELPPPFDAVTPHLPHSLPTAPVVPSSSRETLRVHARLRIRGPSKESSKTALEDRKYTCDFCPVQMARLHDINRHMRIHTGVHPYACAGCGETFRRTDARTRHWCKQPECFRIHSIKAPASKTRRRIPTS